MSSIIEIVEAGNPAIIILPMVLVIISGYTVGEIISRLRGMIGHSFMKDLVYGNLVLNFLFLSAFMIFALTFAASAFFTVFTYILFSLTILGAYFLLKKIIVYVTNIRTVINETDNSQSVSKKKIQSLFVSNHQHVFVAFGISLVAVLLVFQAVVIYYHTIFNEYDSLYLFLPVSKSILLGNGLNHDFYLGSDVNMRFAPFVQAINAWMLQSFEYSSMRIFPLYYVSFTAILIYLLARNILSKDSNKKDASFFGLMATSAFLVTPALLVTSSRFSLQQDIPFIFFLTASFYFLSEIIRYEKPSKTNLLMLSCSLALMILTREIGLLISIAFFFIVPAIKYTDGNLKLRFLFTVISLLPFYFYYLFFYGTYPINSGLIIVILSNLAIFYIVSKISNQTKFSLLVRSGANFKYVAPLLIPVIFIATNMISFNGIYPDITFSDKFYENINLQLDIFANQKGNHEELIDAIEGLPRLDVLLLATASGAIFIILKLIGLGRIVYQLKNNSQYSLLIIVLIFLLISWSALLQSGFKVANIRHIAYFVPILSLVLIVGMKTDEESNIYWKLYCYFVIVFATYYFLSFSLHTLDTGSKFEGFVIDPIRSPIITTTDLVVGILLASPPLFIFGLKKLRLLQNHERNFMIPKLPLTITVISLSILLVLQIYTITFSDLAIRIPTKQDVSISPGWENYVFEVINYLNASEKGNVLAVRAPAIPFFTNRTSFDLYYPQSFAYSVSDLILSKNSSSLKQKLTDMDIKYIIIPNERSSIFYIVENLMKRSQFIQTINADVDFEKVVLKNFNIYKYARGSESKIDLIDENHLWKPFGRTPVEQNESNLTVRVNTTEKGREFNRAYLQTKLDLANKPLLLSIDYNLDTIIGNATYLVEIRDINDKILFEGSLENLSGNFTNQTFLLPKDIKGGQTYEFRVYLITQGPGYHALIIKKLSILYA